MKRVRIALFVADVRRDLPGILLTAYQLCQKGAECFVLPFRGGIAEIWALAPDFVFMPVFRPYVASTARAFAGAGIQFGLLDTEGAIWSSLDEYRQTLWRDPELTRLARTICVWGPMIASYGLSEGIFFPEQVTVTGSPRFDFYRPPLDAVFGAPREKRTILINTNYTVGNLNRGRPEEIVSKIVRTYGYERSKVLEAQRNDAVAVPEMAALAERLASDFPDLRVVLRPHPQENAATYRKLLSPRENLSFSDQDSIYPWILRSCAVIQRSCTTALEACMAGGVAISPQWIPASTYYPAPEFVSYQMPDYEHLRDAVADLREGRLALPEELQASIRSVLRDCAYEIDGLAHKRVADAAMSSISDAIHPDLDRCRKHLYRVTERGGQGGSQLARQIRYRLHLSPQLSFRRWKPEPQPEPGGWSIDAARKFVRRLAEAKSGESPAQIRLDRATNADYPAGVFEGRAFVMRRSA